MGGGSLARLLGSATEVWRWKYHRHHSLRVNDHITIPETSIVHAKRYNFDTIKRPTDNSVKAVRVFQDNSGEYFVRIVHEQMPLIIFFFYFPLELSS